MLENKKILITGGLGFIGVNAALYFSKNNEVCVVDNCSRLGVENNIDQLNQLGIRYHDVDIANFLDLRKVYDLFTPDVVLHLAGQVAVTLSILDPRTDFRSNLLGTFNLLEVIRLSNYQSTLIYASTNKVYGEEISSSNSPDLTTLSSEDIGISENVQLSFGTPYGCSKGAADQYVIDYAKTYQIPTVVFRQSCIYGPYQYGIEDQGWVAWFSICALLDFDITIYGDGTQVRDLLYIDDLIQLYEKAILNIDEISGQAFNIGGGPQNRISLNQLIDKLNNCRGKEIPTKYEPPRQGDQKVYVSNIEKISSAINWAPQINIDSGLSRLLSWIETNEATILRVHSEKEKARSSFDLSIVLPARNEEESLNATLTDIGTFLRYSNIKTEVILVDDGSTDATVAIAKNYPFLRILPNNKPHGKGAALRTGFDAAQGAFLVMMDADYSHDVAQLEQMFELAQRTNGLVIASRITGGSEEYTRVRAFGNIFLTWLFGVIHGRYLSDALNGYKLFPRDIYSSYQYTSTAFEIEIELLANALRLDRQISEIPSRERARMGGTAKSSVVRHGTRFALRILKEKVRSPRQRS